MQILKSIKLTNFRNCQTQNFKFEKNITILIGDNAQGKSNFLESIYFLATGKSNRADKEEELIRYGERFLTVESLLEDKITLEIAVQINEGFLQKKVRVNGIPRKVSDYATYFAVILFSPEDINLVGGPPSLRRDHIDQIISQVDRNYKKAVSSYENIIMRKNKILKSIRERQGKVEELSYWLDQQIILGQIISLKRREFFEFINKVERKFGEFAFKYLESEITNERLKEYLENEIDAAASLIGPHRDDFLFLLKDLDLAKFGSRGEQRTAVLDLKLAQVSFVENILGKRPVLLLDDIFSELDVSHRKHVIALAALQQTVIATVEFDGYLKEQFKASKVVRVKKGKIKT